MEEATIQADSMAEVEAAALLVALVAEVESEGDKYKKNKRLSAQKLCSGSAKT